MAAFVHIVFYLGVIAYSAASTLFFLDLARRDGLGVRSPWAPRVLGVAGALHLGHIVTASLLLRLCPVESLHFGLSFSALVAVGAYLSLYRRANQFAMGAVIAPLALTFLVGAEFVGKGSEEVPDVSHPFLAFHIAANVLGFGLFMVAGASGLLYLFQERRLRHKQAAGFGARLPSLDALDRATHRLLVAGFPLLTLGVVTGAVFSRHLESLQGAALARTLLGVATWLLLAVVLLLRRLAGMRGRRAAYGTLAGVIGVLLVILVYAVRPGSHGS
jgi:ABC-type uncharacterized transport system permease subunit